MNRDKEYELSLLLDKLESTVRYHSNEVGLQTYGRKPHEMLQTDQRYKLQMAERYMRNLRDECFKMIDEAKKIVERKTA